MPCSCDLKLKRKVVFDDELGLDRICWILESACSMCGCFLDTVFDERPDEMTILEAQLIPCDDCMSQEWDSMEEMQGMKNERSASRLEPLD